MKKNKNKIIAGIIIIFVLALVYWWGGNAPSLRGWAPAQTEPVQISQSAETEEQSNIKNKTTENDEASTNTDIEKPSAENLTSAIKKEENTSSQTTQASEPTTETETTDENLFCTLSVRCDTILNNFDWLDKNKTSFVPSDGTIFPKTKVVFYEGESVFNVLSREMKKNQIHLEFMSTPIYNSAYIEGIANLYEYDCGELSGWMYKVNGTFPTYGCSRYILKSGDIIEWLYTCDLGADIGNRNLARQKDE